MQYSPTMTADDIRRENARWLAKRCGGAKRFADLLDLTESRVSQLIGKNPTKKYWEASCPRN